MIKELILQQKAEKEKFLSKEYFPREVLGNARQFLDSDLIKLITGPRRAGKSIFAFLLLQDRDFAYVNFDDENLLAINNNDDLLKAISEVYPACKYIFFDEIQNLKNWELFVNRLQRRGFNVILTGSNARLLDSELATALTGRYISINLFPFSLSEFLVAKQKTIDNEVLSSPEKKGEMLNMIDAYMHNGGFPEIIKTNIDAKAYLETLFDAVLLRDVVKRHNVRFPQQIYDLAAYVLSNFPCECSFTKLRDTLQLRSTATVQKYIGYLEEAYILFCVNRFSYKMKEQIKATKKIYAVDNGFALAKSFQAMENNGRLLENLVFIELLRQGFKVNDTLFYYRTKNNREVDFVLRKEQKVSLLLQVSYDVSNKDTREREVKSLCEAEKELGCKDLRVITWDYQGEEEYEGSIVKFSPIWNVEKEVENNENKTLYVTI